MGEVEQLQHTIVVQVPLLKTDFTGKFLYFKDEFLYEKIIYMYYISMVVRSRVVASWRLFIH